MNRLTRCMVLICGIPLGFHVGAEDDVGAASLTTQVTDPSLVGEAIQKAAIQARLQERAVMEKELEKGELAIDFSSEQKVVRYADLFRKTLSGDEAAARAWGALTPSDRVPALARTLSYAPADLRKKALAELAHLSRSDDPDGNAWPSLVEAALEDSEADIRKGALAVLLSAEERQAEIAKRIIKDFRRRGPEGRARALDALKAMGGPAVRKVVVEHYRDIWGPGPRAHFFVARQQSYIADYEISGDSYDPIVRQFLVGVILDVKPLLTIADTYLVKILRDLTEHDAGKDLKDWRAWWEEEQRGAAQAKVEGEKKE